MPLTALQSKRDATLLGAVAPNYARNQRNSADRYKRFAALHGIEPFPVTFHSLSLWGTSARQLGKASSTVITDCRNLKAYCLAAGIEYLTDPDDLKQWRRFAKGLQVEDNSKIVKQAAPLRMHHLEALFEALSRGAMTPRQEQQWLMVLLSHQLCLRFTELATLDLTSVQVMADGYCRVTINGAKAHRAKAPRHLWLAPMADTDPDTVHPFDISTRLARHVAMLEPFSSTGSIMPLFPKLAPVAIIKPVLPPKRLTYPAWRKQFRSMMIATGLDPSSYTTHSPRAGGLVTKVNNGMPPELAAREGRWASDAFRRYLRPDGRELADRSAQALRASRSHKS